MSKSKVTDDAIAEETANHLNKVLEDGLADDGDVVVLDEKLHEVVSEHRAQATPEELEENASPLIEGAGVSSMVRTESLVLESAKRYRARLLYFTFDATMLNEESELYKKITDLRKFFLEIHVVVLTLKVSDAENPILRLNDNVWVYTTNSKNWWRQIYDAYSLAESQLYFAGEFRADIVMADTLFEAGLAGYFLSRKYKKPFQLHISENFNDMDFVQTHAHPVLYEWSFEFLLSKVKSIRTKTEILRQAVISFKEEIEPNTEVLPQYYNLETWKNSTPVYNLHEAYPQFNFIMLHVSSMSKNAHSMEILLAASKILRQYPSIGLVMVGHGPQRALLEKTAVLLQVQRQVLFEPMPTELVSHMKTANVLIHFSENGEDDGLLLEASVAGLPLIASTQGLSGKLFEHNQSAILCDINNTSCIVQGINRYLSHSRDRIVFAEKASEIVFERIEQDYTIYIRSYAESIERCMVEDDITIPEN